MMGSGGLVVLDETDCMVDIARYFLSFTQSESCGKCTFCRVGTKRMLDIMEKLCEGKAKEKDLDELGKSGSVDKKRQSLRPRKNRSQPCTLYPHVLPGRVPGTYQWNMSYRKMQSPDYLFGQ
jgi:NADH-quinone oxidoreductase subunit F